MSGSTRRAVIASGAGVAVAGAAATLAYAARPAAAAGAPSQGDATAADAGIVPFRGERQAGITTVRPTAMRDRFLMKIASLSGSSALAASSRIRMRGLASSERAMDRRCFWPPDRFDPFSSSMVS